MALELRSACEKCGVALPPDAVAYICIYECTWCPACTELFEARCPNCKGELKMRPRKAVPPPSPEARLLETVWRHVADAPARAVADGVTVRTLWSGPGGRRALLVEIAPGGRWRGLDLHEPGCEEIYVARGVFHDGMRDYPEGTFIHCPAGSAHRPASGAGCALFVFYPDG